MPATTDEGFTDLLEALCEENPALFLYVCAQLLPEARAAILAQGERILAAMLKAKEAAQDGPQSRKGGRTAE